MAREGREFVGNLLVDDSCTVGKVKGCVVRLGVRGMVVC